MLLLNLLKEEKIRTTEPKAEEFEIVLKVSQARTHLKVQLKNSYFMLVLAPGVCPPGGYLRCPQRSWRKARREEKDKNVSQGLRLILPL